jgi:hypothetical protein
MRPRPVRLSLAGHALATLVLALAAAGCAGPGDGGDGIATVGGTASPSASPDGGAAGLTQEEQALKFARGMREHGVDMPDPEIENGRIRVQIGGGKADMATVEAAHEACREYAPMGGPNGGKPDPQMQENMRKMAQCMREHGVEDFPDPQPDGGIRINGNLGDDPDFEAARKVCEAQFMPGVRRAEG